MPETNPPPASAPPTHAPDRAAAEARHFVEGALKPLPDPPPDHFTILGLPRRLRIDEAATRDTYLHLSRRTHPDFFATEDEGARGESLQRSSLVNNAWKTLRDPARRAEYFLTLLAPAIESNKQAVPPELLEEMFEIQEAGEALREARLAADGEALAQAEEQAAGLRKQVGGSRDALRIRLEEQFAEVDGLLDGGAEANSEPVLEALRGIRLTLDRLNYLRTVLRNLH